MKFILKGAAALSMMAGSAGAGALDRTGQPVNPLFEDGRYIEFSLGYVSPDLSGTNANPFLGPIGAQSGDIGVGLFSFGGAYKGDINEDWSYALIIDQPFLSEVDYPTNPFYFGSDASAEFNSVALTALLQYNFSTGFSAYGGLRLQETDAEAVIPFAQNYTVEADTDWGLGYVAGVAYERPDIALRVSLTYSSEIAHKNDVVENADVIPVPDLTSTAEFETPQSVNLEFQTGIAQDTLLFGGIRWVDWSDFDLSPQAYSSPGFVGQPLLSYVDDVTTYSIGLGRRLNETWAISGSLSYEENTENLFTNLGPNDGLTSVGLAAVYTKDKVTITTGVRYAWIGDTTTAVQGVPAAEFNDNTAIAVGFRVGYNF
ncbi:MAG: outer membrane beta-barrel protein [Pseudomonadota bacterium]